MNSEEPQIARDLIRRLRPGARQPELTDLIARCRCPPEAKAGMYLLNGDWERAHTTLQGLDSPVAAYWHALVHRYEPDYANSKYWLRRVGNSPIHAKLLHALEETGKRGLAAPNGTWDPIRFTDLYADRAHDGWTRKLERVETAELLELSLAL